jgi:hypothetical protein
MDADRVAGGSPEHSAEAGRFARTPSVAAFEVVLYYAREAGAAARARHAIRALVLPAFEPARLAGIELAFTEMVTPALSPAGDDAPPVEVRVSLDERRLRIAFLDESSRLSGLATPADHGWGARLIEQSSDRWGVDPPKTGPGLLVWAEFDR